MVSTVPSRVGGLFCKRFACSPCVCVGSLWVLQLPPTHKNMQVRLTGNSKLPVGVNVNVYGVSCLSLNVSWDRVHQPCDPALDKR